MSGWLYSRVNYNAAFYTEKKSTRLVCEEAMNLKFKLNLASVA